jgi:arginine deiminase
MWTVKSESGAMHAVLIQDTTRNFWENKLPFAGSESNLQYLPRCPHADYDAGGHDQWLKLEQYLKEEGVQVFEVTSILRKIIEHASEAERKEIIRKFWDNNPHAPSPAELKVEHITDGYPPTPYYDQATGQVILPDFKRASWTYARDTSFTTQLGTVICNMRRYSRLMEPKVVKLAYESDPVLREKVSIIWDANDLTLASTEPPNIEGGDAEIIDEETIAVGVGQRSTFTGFTEFAKKIFTADPNKKLKYLCAVYIADYPAIDYMHLDVIINFPANRKALIMPYCFESEIVKDIPPKKLLLRLLAATRAQSERDARPMQDVVAPSAFEKAGQCFVYTRGERNEPILQRREVSLIDFLIKEDKLDKDGLIYVAGEPKQKNDINHLMLALMEQARGATNIVTIKSGTIISYARPTATIEALQQKGIRVKKWEDSYLDMLGGPHCSTAPISRDLN